MVLVVSDIYWTFPDSRSLTAPPELGEGNASQTAEHHHPTPPQISGIELTDGWYRINAQIDPVLDYAIRCGKLRVGCKLLTVGAKVSTPSYPPQASC